MRVRSLDSAGDMTFGQGNANYLVNSPQCVGQVASTRLQMKLGDWFLDTTDGTPYQTEVLGYRSQSEGALAIADRIRGTQGFADFAIPVNGSRDPVTRALTVSATIDTIYSASIGAPGNVTTTSTAPVQVTF